MRKSFYDGKKRPVLYYNWTQEDLDRVCINCGMEFGKHCGYNCSLQEKESKQ